jgi:hypothetical protein
MSKRVYDPILQEHLGARKHKVIQDMGKFLSKYGNIPDDTKRNIISDARNFSHLAFLNPQFLSIAILMHNDGINLNTVKQQLGLLDKYVTQYISYKKPKEGLINDMLRYVIIVQNHTDSAGAISAEIKRERMNAEIISAEAEEYAEVYEDDDYDYGDEE